MTVHKKSAGKNNPFVSNPDSVIIKKICGNIYTLYRNSAKTQEEFAEFIGVPPSYIKGVLQKRFAPSHAVIERISNLFAVSIDWIYGKSRSSWRKVRKNSVDFK